MKEPRPFKCELQEIQLHVGQETVPRNCSQRRDSGPAPFPKCLNHACHHHFRRRDGFLPLSKTWWTLQRVCQRASTCLRVAAWRAALRALRGVAFDGVPNRRLECRGNYSLSAARPTRNTTRSVEGLGLSALTRGFAAVRYLTRREIGNPAPLKRFCPSITSQSLPNPR
jgi:hypothetical protein